MTFSKRFVAEKGHPSLSAEGFRARTLQILTWAAFIASIPAAIANIIPALRQGDVFSAGLYTAAVLFLALLVFLGRYPSTYTVRVWGLVGIGYLTATIAYLSSGVGGDGRVLVFTSLALGTLLLPMPHNIINFFGGLAFHFVIGYAISRGWFAPPPEAPAVDSLNFVAWLRTGAMLSGVGFAVGAALTLYRRNLERSLEESSMLNQILEKERRQLEEQQANLERRLFQIRTASEISRVLNTILDPDELINRVVNLIRDRFDLYYVGVFLVDERGEYAVLRAGTGEAGRRMLAEGHRLAIGGASMIGWAISNRRPRIALDVGEEAVRFANPHLPLTRTELALPLISRGEVLGAVTVQSEKPRAFDEEDLTVLQSIVDNLAAALHNARLYQETQASLRALAETQRRLFAEALSDQEEQIEIVSGEPLATDENASGEGEENVFTLEVPLLLHGQSVGNLVFQRPDPWGEEDVAFAKQAAAQLGVALENLYLLEHLQRQMREDRLMSEITQRIGETMDFDQIVQTALRELHNLMQVTEAEIHLAVPEMEA